MADILGGETFMDGGQVTAARLNNHVNGAVITETFISGKPSAAPATADWILYWKGGLLKKTQLNNVVGLGGSGTVTSVGLSMPNSTFGAVVGSPVTGTGTLEVNFISQPSGSVLIGPVDSGGVPTWRRLEPRDRNVPAVAIPGGFIDWNLGDVFYQVLATHRAFTFTNNASGRTIRVILGQTGVWQVSWPATVKWEGGVAPVMTTGNGKYDWYEFTQYAGNVFGARIGANMT